jgi:cytidyltransferase-like protein
MGKPLIVEIAGMPKAGKDRLIKSVEYHFRRAGYRVNTIDEGARRCPFDKSHHFEFTSWGLFSILQSLLEEVYIPKHDLVFINRGLYDVEVMIEMLKQKNDASAEEAKVLAQVASLTSYRDMIDMLMVCMCSPSESLFRERKDRVAYSEGRIMNREVLGLLHQAYVDKIDSWRYMGERIVVIDTESLDFLERAKLIVDVIGRRLRRNRTIFPALINSKDELSDVIKNVAAEGKKITMVKGCYDMLHAGHINFLLKAKELGDILCVLLFDDPSVSKRKGPGRPKLPMSVRANLLLQLKSVDIVATVTDEDLKELPGNLPVTSVATTKDSWDSFTNCQVIHINRTDGISTSDIIDGKPRAMEQN